MTFYTDVWMLTAKGSHLFSVPAAASGLRVGINLLMLRGGVPFRDGRIKQVLLQYQPFYQTNFLTSISGYV